MGRKGDGLFELVKLLDPVEIRDIYQFAGAQGKEKNHMRLFALLCRMEEYDPAIIDREFAGEPFLNHLSRVKNYLYNYIFKALTAYYRQPNADLEDLIRQVNIAHNKGKLNRALESIEKAKEIARDRERFSDWLFLLKKERSILLLLPHLEAIDLRLDSIREAIQHVTCMLDNLNQYEALEDDIIKRARLKYLQRGVRATEFVQKIADNPLMDSIECALSVRAQLKYQHNLFEIARANQDFAACIQVSEAAAHLFERHRFLLEENRDAYFKELARLGSASMAVGDLEAARNYVDQLSAQNTSGPLEAIHLQKNLITLQLAFANQSGESDYGRMAAATLTDRYDQFFPKIRDEENLLIHWLVVKFFFQEKDYFKASGWIHRYFNQTVKQVRVDLEITLRLIHLILLFEQSDWESLTYYARRHLRFMHGLSHANQFERSLIRFLKKVPSYLHEDRLQEGLINLKQELGVIFEDPAERYALNYFDILAWLDSRIQAHSHITLH